MPDITTTLNACELVWKQQSIPASTIAEMRTELESHLREASKFDMPSQNETAVIEVQLANLAAQRGNWPEVNKRVKAIRKLKVTEPMVLEQVGMLEKAYRNRGNVKLAQRMGMARGQGSKRRRPRAR